MVAEFKMLIILNIQQSVGYLVNAQYIMSIHGRCFVRIKIKLSVAFALHSLFCM